MWIDTQSSIDSTLHGSGREVNKGILFQIEKTPEASGGDLTCHVFSLEDETARLNVANPSSILAIEEREIKWRWLAKAAPLRMDLHLALCIFLLPLRGPYNFVVVSLFDSVLIRLQNSSPICHPLFHQQVS